jgi:hypothetical protein
MPAGADATGLRVTVAVADLEESAALVAFTVTVWAEVMEEGAVYRPEEEMDPAVGEMDQVTAVLDEPVTVAANWRVCEAVNDAVVGLTLTVTTAEPVGANVITEVSVFVESATLVALTVTDCVDVMLAGAVYRPLEDMVPTAGLMDQATAVLEVSVNEAVNCVV